MARKFGVTKSLAAAAVLAFSFTGVAQAALVLQSNAVEVLDTNTNLLWLSDWRSSGTKNWGDANTWAAGLTVGGAQAGDWRLPEIGEYAALWINIDAPAVFGLEGRNGLIHWTSTEAPFGAWYFRTPDGFQFTDFKETTYYAVGVRVADVVAAVPEPHVLGLVGFGLLGVAASRRRRS